MSEKVVGILIGILLAAFVSTEVIIQGFAYVFGFMVLYVLWNMNK